MAVGPTTPSLHTGWMNSPGHRANLLNGDVNRVGIAVVRARGGIYAVADYARGVTTFTQEEVEKRIADLIRVSGVKILGNPEAAREACVVDRGLPMSNGGPQAMFVERWQDSMLGKLPKSLREHLASGEYRMAAVGSCPAQSVEGSFTMYRVAVLLY